MKLRVVAARGKWWWLLAVLVLATGCGIDTTRTVPVGDRPALEKLADAYRKIAEGLPGNPLNQTPEDRRRFVEAVFRDAGYGYEATLLKLGEEGLDPNQALHRDLAQLVLLPSSGLTREDTEKIYSRDELAAVSKLQETLR